eukprot:5776105-Pyramimonas_sp.AAC.1
MSSVFIVKTSYLKRAHLPRKSEHDSGCWGAGSAQTLPVFGRYSVVHWCRAIEVGTQPPLFTVSAGASPTGCWRATLSRGCCRRTGGQQGSRRSHPSSWKFQELR